MKATTCDRFLSLSDSLQREAHQTRDQALIQSVNELVEPYRSATHRLPRSRHQRLHAQQVLRRFLMSTREYGLVYAWYEAFKSPYGEDVDANLALYVKHLENAADGFSWIRGYDTVLECGCGAESLGLVLARHNRRWIGSDIYVPEALEPLKAHFAPVGPFEFSIINGVTLEGIADESVDAVVSRSFFEHLLLDDANQHLRSARRVLRPGGQFICLCPAGIGPPSDVTQEFPEFDTPQGLHIKEYRVRELAGQLRAAGFDSVRSRFIRLRGLSNLPSFVNQLNSVPVAVAATFESAAAATWPAARGSSRGRALWKSVWGHLGATPLLLVASRDAA